MIAVALATQFDEVPPALELAVEFAAAEDDDDEEAELHAATASEIATAAPIAAADALYLRPGERKR